MMNVPSQSQLQPASDNEVKSYVQTPVGLLKVVTIILGTIAVGLGYTEVFEIPKTNRSLTEEEWKNYASQQFSDYGSPDNFNGGQGRRPTPPSFRCSQPEETERYLFFMTAIALILSVASLHINSSRQVKFKCPDAAFHKVVGLLLIIAGIMSAYAGASPASNDNESNAPGCACKNIMKDCWYIYQLAAGVITLLNGIIYCALGYVMINKTPPVPTVPSPVQNLASPSRAQNMPMQNMPYYPRGAPLPQNMPGFVPVQPQPYQNNMQQFRPGMVARPQNYPSRLNMQGSVPVQKQQQPIQNMQQYRPPPAAPVQQNVAMAQPPPPPPPPKPA